MKIKIDENIPTPLVQKVELNSYPPTQWPRIDAIPPKRF
ncbi:MAG: hypothetical protein HW380_274 [Magnetococcales bacterium]|nr:hypothetical protein [Magnetococcales bacterium]